MPLSGEEIQALGADGAERAKRWLEATCRAEVKWNNPGAHVKKLQFRKASAASDSTKQGDFFSMDLGGTLLGGDADGDMFVAEVKSYSQPGNQGSEYRLFVAKCYCIESTFPYMYEHYLWLTWSPFSVKKWQSLLTQDFVRQVVSGDGEASRIALGDNQVDETVAQRVANKLLIVVLAEKQERILSLHGDELLGVRQALLQLRNNS